MTQQDQLLNLLRENTEITTRTAVKLDAVAADVAALKVLPERVALLEARAAQDIRAAEAATAAKASVLARFDRYRLFRWGAMITLLSQIKMGERTASILHWIQHWTGPASGK